jgi:hypothetical protein
LGIGAELARVRDQAFGAETMSGAATLFLVGDAGVK